MFYIYPYSFGLSGVIEIPINAEINPDIIVNIVGGISLVDSCKNTAKIRTKINRISLY